MSDTKDAVYEAAERAWLRESAIWESRGFKPGQFTAFIEGYKAAVEAAKGTPDDLFFDAQSSPTRRRK